jgi:hypothetical protein
MAITKQNTPGSRNINIQYVQNLFRLFPVQRIALHLYAYITVFRIFILTLVSLIFLSIHWTYCKLFSTRPIVETNEWDLNSTN